MRSTVLFTTRCAKISEGVLPPTSEACHPGEVLSHHPPKHMQVTHSEKNCGIDALGMVLKIGPAFTFLNI